jgi:hypothetical protein
VGIADIEGVEEGDVVGERVGSLTEITASMFS